MWTISELKQSGKAAFQSNYWKCVVAAFLLSLLTGGISIASRFNSGDAETITENAQNMSPQVLGLVAGASLIVIVLVLLFKIFVTNPLSVGCYTFFLRNTEDHQTDLDVITSGFSNFINVFLTLLLRDIFIFLWSLLFIIPGLIKMYSYRMVPYILAENPTLSPTECITRSKEMMSGNKWNAFVFDLSFIGWLLLSALTCGLLNIFWTKPYKESANAALYLKLKEISGYTQY